MMKLEGLAFGVGFQGGPLTGGARYLSIVCDWCNLRFKMDHTQYTWVDYFYTNAKSRGNGHVKAKDQRCIHE